MAEILEAMMTEIQKETATTRRVLERVPADKLSWKPHPKSMSLGQLSLHIALIPSNLSKLAQLEEFDVSTANFDFPPANRTNEILAALDAGVEAAQEGGGVPVADSQILAERHVVAEKFRSYQVRRSFSNLERIGL
jgi:hypothetical protein